MLNERECLAAGVDPAELAKLARMLNKAGRLAQEMGVTIFGGSGTGTLRKRAPDDDSDAGLLILATLDGVLMWDGGDGACREAEDGFLRGE